MKKKFLYTLAAFMAVTVTSCKDDDISDGHSALDLERMPRTMFCTSESTGEDKEGNLHIVTEELNTIYVPWFKVNGAAGYQIRYADSGSMGTHLDEEAWWLQFLIKDIYVGENVLSVVPDDIKSQALIVNDYDPHEIYRLLDDTHKYVVIPADINEFYLCNLSYGTDFAFAIRVLSPLGEDHNSAWWGYGDAQHWGEQCKTQKTEERYAQPLVLNYTSRGENSIGVNINLRAAEALDGATANDILSYKENFEWTADSTMFVADMIRVTTTTVGASLDQKWIDGVPLSEFEFVNGSADIVIDNLSPFTTYYIDLVNNHIPVKVDATYNKLVLSTTGQRGDVITIEHKWENDTNLVAAEYQACCIDGILTDFMENNTIPEGQVYYLEGGKLYYFASSVSLYKGFTLETRPEDVAKGLRAKVYMGGLVSKKGNKDIGTVGQLVLGRAKRDGEGGVQLPIEKIAFRNLDIEAPEALNYGAAMQKGTSATGNYFLNMLSSGIGIHFDELEIRNCTFQGLIRGFFRLQGSERKTFDKVTIDNCVFYNCGYYSSNGASYAMFAGDGASAKSNPWMDFQFTNNTIYDSPWQNIFLLDNNKNLAYPESVKWNVRVENNTFINHNTRAAGRNVFSLQYVPSGSFISFKNNLIAIAADDRDIRNLNCGGVDLRNISGTTAGIPQLTLDIENNYSVGCRDNHLKPDGIWSSGAPSASNNSFGKFWAGTPGLLQGEEAALQTKVGQIALLPTELFKNPNPPFFAHDPNVYTAQDHIAPDNIWDALRIVPSGRCTSDHEIVAKKIGAPRWYSGDPEHFSAQ